MTDKDSDLLSIFRDEVSEYLTLLNDRILQAETAEISTDLLRELNRVAHSMKGAARAVGFATIESVAHHIEEVFDGALHQRLSLTPVVCDALYDGLDLIQQVINGEDVEQATLELVLQQLEAMTAVQPAPAPPVAQTRSSSMEIPALRPDELERMNEPSTLILRSAEDSVRVTVGKLDRLMAEVSELLVARMQGEERLHELAALRRLQGRWRREWQRVRGAYIRLARRLQDEDGDLRDDLTVLFKFLETNQRYLVENATQLAMLSQGMSQDNLRLATLSDQLQDDISRMRLVSFETLLSTFQRMMRDLARDIDKQVHFEVVGASVEFDKTVLDALKDPITHLLRNAVDHGIELPSVRERLGKSPVGRVSLVVEQRGSEVIVLVMDDGRGIDPKAIRYKAVQSGVMNEQDAALMTDEDVQALIFHPGLSTSDQVTTISGRGIGMDIVRSRVEGLRGRVSVSSRLGRGTTINLTVPVSLTRIRCVLLRLGDEYYAIPSTVIERMMLIQRDDVFTAESREMIIVDERPVPLVVLGQLLGISGDASGRDQLRVVVVRVGDRPVAFEVDELESERELVLKPLGKEIARSEFVSGAALLGTGEVVIVLDANDLVRRASGITLNRRPQPAVSAAPVEKKLRILIVDDSITTRTLEKNILETAGFEVQAAMDGVQAWQMLHDMTFDVIISDVEMPNMDGLELTRQIRSSSLTRHIPVILLTSLSRPEQREAGLKAGASAYLVKSQFDQGELIRAIHAVV